MGIELGELSAGLPSGGLAALGLVLVALLHAAYAAFLLRSGLLRQSQDRPAQLYLLAVLATAAWGLVGWIDLDSSKRLSWHLALLFDQLRYAAWLLFLLLLLRPLMGGRANRSTRAVQWALVVMLLAGGCANLVEGLQPERWPAMAWVLLASQLAAAVVGLLLVEQFFRNQTDPTRWSAKPLCMALGGLFMFDVYLFSQALMFGGFDPDAQGARALVHALTMPLLLMASRRHAQWLARMQVSKSAAFYSASLLLIGGYLLFIASAGYYVRIAVNQEANSGYQAQTDSFVTQQGFNPVANDYGPGLGTNRVRFMFQNSGQPIFAVINGVTNSPTHQPWQLLVNHLGYGQNDFHQTLAGFRSVIDTVQSAAPPPQLAAPRRTGTNFDFNFTAQTNRIYRVQTSTNLTNWVTLRSVSNVVGNTLFRDTNAPPSGRFYRAVTP